MVFKSILGDMCACFMVVSFNAGAALIDNGTYTTDTASGLDWLDLTETTGLSFNYVSSQPGANGQFEGWSYAGITRIDQLVQNA